MIDTISASYAGEDAPARIHYVQHTLPPLADRDLLVRVRAAGLNHADMLQRQGRYRPPSGDSQIPGIEIAGTVCAVGPGVRDFVPGDLVCGVVSGGGFSQYCLLDSGMALPIPDGWSFEDAAAFPEAALTAHEALCTLGELTPHQSVVIHAASSGVGTLMVRMARQLNATVIATTTSPSKVPLLKHLGAKLVIPATPDYDATLRELVDGADTDLVVDFLGGCFLDAHLRVLKPTGRLVLAGILDGPRASIDLPTLINRRITLLPLTLRMKPLADKRVVTQRFLARWAPKTRAAHLRPLVHSVFPFRQLDDAQALMQSGRHTGKIVLNLDDALDGLADCIVRSTEPDHA